MIGTPDTTLHGTVGLVAVRVGALLLHFRNPIDSQGTNATTTSAISSAPR